MALELEVVYQERNVWYSVLVMKQLYLTALCRGNRHHCQADCSLSGYFTRCNPQVLSFSNLELVCPVPTTGVLKNVCSSSNLYIHEHIALFGQCILCISLLYPFLGRGGVGDPSVTLTVF